jgi:hypothetical protein
MRRPIQTSTLITRRVLKRIYCHVLLVILFSSMVSTKIHRVDSAGDPLSTDAKGHDAFTNTLPYHQMAPFRLKRWLEDTRSPQRQARPSLTGVGRSVELTLQLTSGLIGMMLVAVISLQQTVKGPQACGAHVSAWGTSSGDIYTEYLTNTK